MIFTINACLDCALNRFIEDASFSPDFDDAPYLLLDVCWAALVCDRSSFSDDLMDELARCLFFSMRRS